MAWMRQLLDWQKEAADPNEFLDNLRYDLSTNQIFVFTPKGDAVTLTAGATPLDFAYAVHTEVGHRCCQGQRQTSGSGIQAENRRQGGDLYLQGSIRRASRDWLEFVVSPRAKNKIRAWFAKERREEATEKGRDLLAAEVQRGGLPVHRLFTADSMRTIATELV